MLVGSIGLVLAVPLTTAVGAAVVRVSGSGTPVGDARSERSATGSPSDDEDTTVLPKTKWRDLGQSEPAASSSAPPAEPAAPGRRRRSRRRQDDDDFGDFTYLHEPGDTDPGSRKDPGARGRTSL